MFWHRGGYINTIHCLCFWVLQKKKESKTGTYTRSVYFHFVYTFCMLLFNRILYSQHYFHFYLLQDIVLPVQVILVQWIHNNNEKMLENMVRILYVMFLFILYCTYRQLITILSSSFHCCWCVELGLLLVYISLQMGAGNYTSFFIVRDECDLFSLGSWQFALCWMWTWVPLWLASYFDGFILLASYFDGCKFRR